MKTYAFIDASNLFYGGEKSLGWKIDYQRLARYLQDKYQVSKILYFGGVETHGFSYDYLQYDTVPLTDLQKYLDNLLFAQGQSWDEARLILFSRHLNRIKFYSKLHQFAYQLYLKPIKLYDQEDGSTKRKANCDVEMAFYLMKEKDNFDRVIILSGDGDFLPVLKYLRDNNKIVEILARGPRAAKEIRQFAGSNFRDFEYLKNLLQMME